MVELAAVEIDETWLPDMLRWLSDPYTNRMTRAGSVTVEGQRVWFASLSSRTDYWIRGIVADGRRIGAFGLKDIGESSAEVFTYVGEPELRGRGVGSWSLAFAAAKARALGITALRAVVANDNEPSQRMFAALGYRFSEARGDWGGVLILSADSGLEPDV